VTDSMQACPGRWRGIRFAMTDRIDQAHRAETAAFEALYRQHVGRVYALCRRLCGDPARAEDLTQETFVRAWRHIGSWPEGGGFAGWLCRMAINVVLSDSRARGRRSRREMLVDDPPERRGTPARPEPGAAIDLEKAIAQLPRGARNVFVLHDIEGFRHEEIATLLGHSPGTSKAQLHRARCLLREALTA
jgi:RNA polymerase sigma-70 factor (ECF subfamily)